MRKIIVLSLALSLGACTSRWVANAECDTVAPMPQSMKVGYGALGFLGLGIAYATDGDAVRDASAKRKDCMDRQTAAQ